MGDLKITDTMFETVVLGDPWKNEPLQRASRLWVRNVGMPGSRMICQRFGYLTHAQLFAEFEKDNATDDWQE